MGNKNRDKSQSQPIGPKGPEVEQLRQLVQRASRENPHLTSRLEKAAFLVLLRPVERQGEDHFRIGSEDGLRFYDVIRGHCQCSDYLRHGDGHPCKHRLALSLHLNLSGDMETGDSAGDDKENNCSKPASTDEWASRPL